jgi:hypothetical protein
MPNLFSLLGAGAVSFFTLAVDVDIINSCRLVSFTEL